jgi:putative oxidoreductase
MESMLTKIVRILLGLLMIAAGAGKFLTAPPPPPNEAAAAFLGALAASGYIFPILAVTEILTGACFLAGRFVALAAVVLFPISLNIFLFHVAIDPSGLAVGIFVLAANVYLLAVSFPKYQDLLSAK